MGKVVELVDSNRYEQNVASVDRHLQDEEYMREKLCESGAFKFVFMAKKYDDWFLDPIVGLILPALYIALFKIRSLKLAYAIMIIGTIDLIVGAIPTVGDLIDAFYKANKKAARWIVGYVDKDPSVKEEVNKTALWGTVGILILLGLIYLCYSLIVALYHWIAG